MRIETGRVCDAIVEKGASSGQSAEKQMNSVMKSGLIRQYCLANSLLIRILSIKVRLSAQRGK
jgi:hypothetical protein